MTVELVLTAEYDRDLRRTGRSIDLEDWVALVNADPDLRLRTEPHVSVNPRTNEKTAIQAREGESEIRIEGEYATFLRFTRGRLRIRYAVDLEHPGDLRRLKMVEIMKKLGAIIVKDAGEEILEW